jgi:hypothetical protein
VKVKRHLWLSDPSRYIAKGEIDITLLSRDQSDYMEGEGYIYLHEVELDVNIDEGKVINKALSALDDKELELKAMYQRKLADINAARKELRTITHVRSA